ncbi:MAG TPA: hypothetical protein VE377_02325 [Candidatus Dormibacteraeota bacterium]|nr:hypothetical protein [Candidatus Dormibacteraeota bacterium]
MDSYGRIAALKIETAQDRAHAVIEEVQRVENRVYASPGSRNLLSFVSDAAVKIDVLLENEKALTQTGLLTVSQIETRLHRITKLIPLLHWMLGFVEGSEVHRSPAQLIPTLRRYAQSILPDSEIVVRSKPELNYSIQDIAKPLAELFKGTPLETSCSKLPDRLFMMSIPGVESGHILIHAVLSHELGHALYNKKEIAKELLPKIGFNENLVKGLVKMMFENQEKQGNPTPELRIRKQVTQEITGRVHGWIKELCSDAIGIRLFGPALFFAAAHLLTSLRPLDKSSETHPPLRLRTKLMIRMLKELYTVERWHDELQAFVRLWDEVSGEPIFSTNPYDQIALETVNDAALDLISAASDTATASLSCYTSSQFTRDIKVLAPLLLSYIPPGEVGPYGQCGTAEKLASIINSGWHVYLCDFETFKQNLHPNDARTRFSAATKLHELVLKALEISGIQVAWEEASRDSKRRKG